MARKPWEEMTFDEKMAAVEEDHEHSLAMQVQREMLKQPKTLQEIAEADASFAERVKEMGARLHHHIHDEILVETDYAKKDAEFTSLAWLHLSRPFVDYGPIEARVLKHRTISTQEISLSSWEKLKNKWLKEGIYGRQEEDRGDSVCDGDPSWPGLPSDEADPRDR